MTMFDIDELVTVTTWSDVVNRPHYTTDIEAKKYKLKDILCAYTLKDETGVCGLSGCGELHSQGFLVSTNNDKETSLCETCGKKFFDVSVEEQSTRLEEQSKLREQQIKLNEVLEKGAEIKDRIKELKTVPYGANWLYRSLNNFRKDYPEDLITGLEALAQQKESGVVDDAGQPEGVLIFTTDIKDIIVDKLLKPLKKLEEKASSPNEALSLAAQCRWADNMESHFTEAQQLVDAGRAFFNKANLKKLSNIAVSEQTARLVQGWQWDCDKGEVKGKKR